MTAEEEEESRKRGSAETPRATPKLPGLPCAEPKLELVPTFTFGPQQPTGAGTDFPAWNDPIWELLLTYSSITPYQRQNLLQLPLPALHLAAIPVPPLERIKAKLLHYILFPMSNIPQYGHECTKPPRSPD